MKLIIILLCVLSERYLTHAGAAYRTQVFNGYFNFLKKMVLENDFLSERASQEAHSFWSLSIMLAPALLIIWALLLLFNHWLLGLGGFLLNLIIFYYTLGPENIFFPILQCNPVHEIQSITLDEEEMSISTYLSNAHDQLFAVIFWYILAGLVGALAYRLLTFAQKDEKTRPASEWLLAKMNWLTLRITLFFYLLVGNFQKGFRYYTTMFFSSPKNNAEFIRTGGLLALQTEESESLTFIQAQTMVEHALGVYLVFLALLTLAAWV